MKVGDVQERLVRHVGEALTGQLGGEPEQEGFGVVGERAADLGERPGLVAVEQAPVPPDQ